MRVTLQEAADKLMAANKILLTAHINPDGDALGSTLALRQGLKSLGKVVEVYIDDRLPRNFAVLPWEERIRRPKEGEKFEADLLVVLDTAPDRIGKVRNLTDAPILNIDHHLTNKTEGVYLYVEPSAAATCEIIFNLLHIMEVEIDKNIANCLYTGIATDTGFFNYSNSKPSTFRAAAELIECGVEPNIISEQMEKRTFSELKGMNTALNTTRLFYDGKIVGMFIDEELSGKLESTEGFIDLIRVIDSVEVAFLLTCKEKNICRVSMRSKYLNVSKVANRLGGGGHFKAAGCTLKMGFDEAKTLLIRSIGEFMVEEGYLLPEDFGEEKETSLKNFEITAIESPDETIRQMIIELE